MKFNIAAALMATVSAEWNEWTDYTYCDFSQKEVEMYQSFSSGYSKDECAAKCQSIDEEQTAYPEGIDMCCDYAAYADGSYSCILYTGSDYMNQDLGDFPDDLFSHFVFQHGTYATAADDSSSDGGSGGGSSGGGGSTNGGGGSTGGGGGTYVDPCIEFDRTCVDDNYVADSWGDTCADYYNFYPMSCGIYDTPTFVAAEACCTCDPVCGDSAVQTFASGFMMLMVLFVSLN